MLFSHRIHTAYKMISIICTLTADTAKVNPILLPVEIVLEKFFANVENVDDIRTKQNFFGWRSNIADICAWRGVTCNAEKSVTHLQLSELHGRVDFDWLPATLQEFSLSRSAVSGEIDCSSLPLRLKSFAVVSTNVCGTLDLSSFCGEIEMFKSSHGTHTGTIDFEELPQSMKKLDLSENVLEGTLNLTNLPAELTALRLSQNNFTGTVNLSCLPPKIFVLALDGNRLSGSIDLRCLKAHFHLFDLQDNCFTGTIDVSDMPPNKASRCDLSRNKLHGDIDFAMVPRKYILLVDGNEELNVIGWW